MFRLAVAPGFRLFSEIFGFHSLRNVCVRGSMENASFQFFEKLHDFASDFKIAETMPKLCWDNAERCLDDAEPMPRQCRKDQKLWKWFPPKLWISFRFVFLSVEKFNFQRQTESKSRWNYDSESMNPEHNLSFAVRPNNFCIKMVVHAWTCARRPAKLAVPLEKTRTLRDRMKMYFRLNFF